MVRIAEARIGATGTMWIDDDGVNIRYGLDQSDGSTNIQSPGKDWALTLNGVNDSGKFTWPAGGGSRVIAGPGAANGSQTVMFSIGDTGTRGFGTGGTIYGTVNRARVPNAPTPATFSNVTNNSMRVAWTLAGDGGSPYDQILLRRSTDPNFGSYVDFPLAANATAYNATGLASNTLYYWRVFAHNAVGYSLPSGATSRRTASAPAAPGTPSASSITPSSMTLSWTLPADGGMPLNQILLRRSLTADFASFTDFPLAANATSYNATGLAPGTGYYWRVYARNVVGYGPASPARQASTTGAPAPGFSITRTDTTSQASLTVPSGTTGFSNFSLQRRIVNSSSVATTDSPSSPINTTGLSPTTRYEWRASAVFGGYRSPWTDWLSTPAAPNTPSATNITPVSMTLSWTKPFDYGGRLITQMVLRYAPVSNPSDMTDVVVGANTTTATVSSLTPGTAYQWRVLARNSVGLSVPSSARTQSTLPAGAPGLTVTAAVSGVSSSAAITPPGGASGFTKFTLQRRRAGTTTPIATLESATSPIVTSGLTPGVRYEYRASAWYGEYQSPWTNWVGVTQPNPNTDPGSYFDGATPNTPIVAYNWTGTAGLSTTEATGVIPTGWRTFAQSAYQGGTGAVFRASGGARGAYCARAVFFTDANAAGLQFGTLAGAEVGENVDYVGSIYAWPSKSQRLRAVIRWETAGGTYISASTGTVSVVPTDRWTRLTVSATSPVGARRAAIVIQDVVGDGWSLWVGGDWLQADAAMISAQSLYPYFDGDTPDSTQFSYEWVGAAKASASLRREVEQAEFDPLLDPDCPVVPVAPEAPNIITSCIDDIGTWRRYWAAIPEEEVFDWLDVVPTLTITTATAAARQVRIRFYQNPDNLAPQDALGLTYESEQVITYIPPRTVITLDGVSESVWASVNGAAEASADHLLVGTGGVPASWPVLSCGSAYLVSFDVPLDAPDGNVVIGAALTTRMM
ncbi:minor tail protein [Microbacterium phage Squash]|uniref:Minor tail protein n=1 Tax=Microbacterium phage Squash TaxID=2182357 RepID=A0A2U8ULN9_9CAUD|nr:minor tail protein [Microbacterium phage Squash]AWN04659.1 minor tail protein [Microbacterium phage Squash]